MKNVNPNVLAAAIVGASIIVAAFVARSSHRYEYHRATDKSSPCIFDTFTGSRFIYSREGNEWTELNSVKGYRRNFTIP